MLKRNKDGYEKHPPIGFSFLLLLSLTACMTKTMIPSEEREAVRQENTDEWQGLLGANVNFNSHWSAMFEYVGFGGDRRQVIAGLNRRFLSTNR